MVKKILSHLWISNNNIDNDVVKLDEIKNSVDKLITPNDIEKIRYFMMELIEKNIWVKPSIETSENTIKIKLKANFNWDLQQTIIYLLSADNNYYLKKQKYISIWYNWTIDLWNIDISFNNYNDFEITIELNKILQDEDLKILKDVLENNFLNKINITSNNINSLDVINLLWLNKQDKCVVNNNQINLSIHTGEKIDPSKQEIQNILNLISLLNRNYYMKLEWISYLDNKNNITIIESWYWNSIQNKYNLSIEFWENEIIINIDSNITINSSFLSNIIKNLIDHISNLSDNTKNSINKLKDMWVMVIESKEKEHTLSINQLYEKKWFIWYDDIKEKVETNIVFPWLNRQQYKKFQQNHFENIKNIIPNASLFEWWPWTGKTTYANIIWEYLNFPFIYLPISSLMSKWYWESEQKLNTILELVWKIWEENGWSVVMIDEIDEIWGNRDKTHEATWRITWVLLKKLDWFEKIENMLLIASTNRKDFLDQALLSRFTQQIFFRNPELKEIESILTHYLWIKNIEENILKKLIWKSWRDLKNLSENFVRYFTKLSIDQDNDNLNKNKEFVEFISKIDIIQKNN